MSIRSERVLFVDLARAAAVLFMIQGHTLQVLLRPDYQGGAVFAGWLYLRGLTSCAFLMLSGFSFSLATTRYWADYHHATPRLRRRLTRFATFLLLGYAMRIPISPLTEIGRVTAEQWQAFATVDILQIVAVTLALLQALAWLASSPRRLAGYAGVAAALVVLLAPLAWRFGPSVGVSVFVAAYLSASTGSIFPVFPWAAYIFFGAALGAWFVTYSARQPDAATDERTAGAPLRALPQPHAVSFAFLYAGLAMIALGVLLHLVPLAPYGALDFWKVSPNLFLVKAGSVLVILAGAVRATHGRRSMPAIVSILSRESLTVYFVHVCILYGSIWNRGLIQVFGPHLGLTQTLGWVVLLAFSMSLLAWLWHQCKQWSGYLSVAIRAAVAIALVYAIA